MATVAINNSVNAALLAIRILGSFIPEYQSRLESYSESQCNDVMKKVELLDQVGWEEYNV